MHRTNAALPIELMALFHKPPAKKPAPAKARAAAPPEFAPPMPGPRAVPAPTARDVAARAADKSGNTRPRVDPAAEVSVTGASLMEWAPAQQAFEVAQANPGLCSVLENAALLYASGQAPKARAILDEGLKSDDDAKQSALAWLALFDLLQRAGDRTAFDALALRYVVQFERSAPPWEVSSKPQPGPRAAPGGYVGLTGKLTAATATQLEPLRRAMAKSLSGTRLDAMSVTGFDDDGARLLAQALCDARRQKFHLQLQRMDKLAPMLDAALKRGVEGGEGAWLLSLELLQWTNDRARFEDRAVEFAVAFEMSPPSWEPPPLPKEAPATAPAEEAATDEGEVVAGTLIWSGVMTGAAPAQLGKLALYAQEHSVCSVDMTAVERVDFVCAGALLNLITRIETQRKSVQITGATPIIRAMLLLIGISPRHFVKKRE
jgi:ABC-type transporter Mla MlaB component